MNILKTSPITRKIMQLVMGNGLIQIANIIVYIMLARWLTMEEYASYRQLFLIGFLISGITFSALPTALLYFCGRVDDISDKSVVIREHLKITLILGVAITILLLFFSSVIAKLLSNPMLEDILIYFAIYPACYIIYSLVSPMLVAVNKAGQLFYFSSFLALLNSIPVLFAAYQELPLQYVVGTASISASIGASIALLLICFYTKDAAKSTFKISKITIYKYAWALLAATAIAMVGMKMDHLLVSNKMGAEIYALYAVGAFEIPIFSLLQGSITTALLPQFANYAKNGKWSLIENQWRKAFWNNSCLLLPFSASLTIFSEELITFFFSAKYAPSAIIFSIYMMMTPLRIMSFGLVIRAIGQNKKEFIGAILYLILISFLVFTSVTYFNLAMVAVSLVVSTLALAIYMSYATYKATEAKINIFKIYPKKALLIFLILLGINYLLKIAASLYISNQISILLVVTVTIILFTLLLLKLNVAGILYEKIDEEDYP